MDHEKIYLIKQLINFILTVLNKKDKTLHILAFQNIISNKPSYKLKDRDKVDL